MRKKHVLILMVSPEVRLGGGIIQVILNYKNQMVNEDILFDFAINIEDDEELIQKLTCNGEKWIQIPNKKKDYLHYLKAIRDLCKKCNYDVVHIHGNSATMLPEVWLAKHYGIRKRIVHCHNSQCGHPVINALLSPYFRTLYTDALACSDLAGEWLFGEDNFITLHNAIRTEDFLFDQKKRFMIREEFGIKTSCMLVGTIGGMNPQKNQAFLLDVFKKMHQERDIKLMIVGDGMLRDELEQRTRKLQIEDKVIFSGYRNDINELLQAFDLFVLPSKFEGFPVVMIEAQAAGLPCVISDKIIREVDITHRTTFLTIVNTDQWVETINRFCMDKVNLDLRERSKYEMKTAICRAGYDIEDNAKRLNQLYCS